MPWLHVDDQMHAHAKIERLYEMGWQGEAALALWARAGSKCQDQGTDGIVRHRTLLGWLLDEAAVVARVDALVAVGLWHRPGAECASCESSRARHGVQVAPAPGEYMFHDWFQVKHSAAAQVELKRKKGLERLDRDLIDAVWRRDCLDPRKPGLARCRYCARAVNRFDRRGEGAAEVDHLYPDQASGIKNLVVACLACNRRKGARSYVEMGYQLLPEPRGEVGRPAGVHPARSEGSGVAQPARPTVMPVAQPARPGVSVVDAVPQWSPATPAGVECVADPVGVQQVAGSSMDVEGVPQWSPATPAGVECVADPVGVPLVASVASSKGVPVAVEGLASLVPSRSPERGGGSVGGGRPPPGSPAGSGVVPGSIDLSVDKPIGLSVPRVRTRGKVTVMAIGAGTGRGTGAGAGGGSGDGGRAVTGVPRRRRSRGRASRGDPAGVLSRASPSAVSTHASGGVGEGLVLPGAVEAMRIFASEAELPVPSARAGSPFKGWSGPRSPIQDEATCLEHGLIAPCWRCGESE